MRPVRQTVSGAGVGGVIPLDIYLKPFNVTLACDLSAGATASYTVQYTLDDVFASEFNPATATWFNHPDLTNQTADAVATLISPVTGIRVNVASNTGSLAFTVAAAGMIG